MTSKFEAEIRNEMISQELRASGWGVQYHKSSGGHLVYLNSRPVNMMEVQVDLDRNFDRCQYELFQVGGEVLVTAI